MSIYTRTLVRIYHLKSGRNVLCSLSNAYVMEETNDLTIMPTGPRRFHDWVLSLYEHGEFSALQSWDRTQGFSLASNGIDFSTSITLSHPVTPHCIDIQLEDFKFEQTDIADTGIEREPQYDEIMPLYVRVRYQLVLYGDLTNRPLLGQIFLCGLCHCLSYCMALLCPHFRVHMEEGKHSIVLSDADGRGYDIRGTLSDEYVARTTHIPLDKCNTEPLRSSIQCFEHVAPTCAAYVKYIAQVCIQRYLPAPN